MPPEHDPQAATTAPEDWTQNLYVQIEGGFLAGVSLGLVPMGLNINSATTRQVLNSLDMKVSDFVGQVRAGSIKGRLPSEVMEMTVEEALQHSSTVRKLLIDTRFVK